LGEEAGEDWDSMVEEMLEEELSGEAEQDPDEEGGKTRKSSKRPDDLGWG
jgi:hypothetical protein